MNFYSQQGEDIYIYRNFINKERSDGIFVELGAVNGVTFSNSKFFEDTLHFSGTLIEPTNQYLHLIANRPNCKNYNVAVNYTKTKVKFLGDSFTAGLVDTMDDKFKNHWHPESQEYYVDGEPFSDILHKSELTYIDLLSIDVEGGEEVVLNTMDFTIPVYVICIELDGHNVEKDERCREILRKNGFLFDRRFCINEFWYNPNYYRKELLYDATKKQHFIYIDELGKFIFLETSCAQEVCDNL